MPTPRVLILRAPGTNCDDELAFAFERAGASAEKLHVARLRENPPLVHQFQILALPGGFSYGDDVAAGKILANQLATFFTDVLHQFRAAGKLILGVCNGFQTLLKAGLILPPDEDGPVATLTNNSCGYQDRWVDLIVTPGKCFWLKNMQRLYVPVAHGEGNFQTRAAWIRQGLAQSGQVVLQYADQHGRPTEEFPANPNGSQSAIAGLCDASGQVLGLMPHPERHALPTQHPRWTREGLAAEGAGMTLFRNAIAYFK